jgi:hypothetical protein
MNLNRKKKKGEKMGEDITLEGKRYKGRFVGEQKKGRVEQGSEYTCHWEDRFYWVGDGTIKDKKTREEAIFRFSTWIGHRDSQWAGTTNEELKLEDALILLEEGYRRVMPNRKKITNYLEVVDLELKAIFEMARSNEDGEIIPNIRPEILSIEELKKKGLYKEG